jgi:hypothetical protein
VLDRTNAAQRLAQRRTAAEQPIRFHPSARERQT